MMSVLKFINNFIYFLYLSCVLLLLSALTSNTFIRIYIYEVDTSKSKIHMAKVCIAANFVQVWNFTDFYFGLIW